MLAEQTIPYYEPSAFQDRRAIARAHDAVERSAELLRRYPRPDIFLGRQTFEPFPKEEELTAEQKAKFLRPSWQHGY